MQHLNVVFEARHMALQGLHVLLLFVNDPLLRLDGFGQPFVVVQFLSEERSSHVLAVHVIGELVEPRRQASDKVGPVAENGPRPPFVLRLPQLGCGPSTVATAALLTAG